MTSTAGAGDRLFTGGTTAVDVALVMAALSDRLGQAGMPISLVAVERAAAAYDACRPRGREELYWLTRLSFVVDRSQLAMFDRVFQAVFDHDLGWARAARGGGPSGLPPTRDDERLHRQRGGMDGDVVDGGGLPWTTRPPVVGHDDGSTPAELGLPELTASTMAGDPDRPFDTLNEAELAIAGGLLETMAARWPRRPSRRLRTVRRGRHPQLRAALRRALRTGGEPLELPSARIRLKLRRVVVLVDVSGSMEAYTRAYLHVARALAAGGRAEVFAFATAPSRITAALRLRSPVEAIERAADQVGDRFGGTRLATSLRLLLQHRVWGTMIRGAVVVVVSDGWDTDPPEEVGRQMARLSRRARHIVWVNPRLSAEDYRPLVGAMAAALPHCDAFHPGHSLNAMADVLDAIVDPRPTGLRDRTVSRRRRL